VYVRYLRHKQGIPIKGRDDMTYDLRRGLRGTVAALAAILICAAPAAATEYPIGKTDFTGSADDWTEAAKDCSLLDPLGSLPLLCSVVNEHDETKGSGDPPPDPPAALGALATRYQSLVNLLTLQTGTGTWTSPDFTVNTAPLAGTKPLLSFDRSAELDGLVNEGGEGTTVITLTDVTAPDPANYVVVYDSANDGSDVGDTISTAENSEFTRTTFEVDAAKIIVGHKYRIQVSTTFTGLLQALNSRQSVYYDNVRLSVNDGASSAPEVATLSPTELDEDSARLNGLVIPRGKTGTWHFEYGENTNYGSSTATNEVSAGATNISQVIEGLKACTVYHYRAVADLATVANPVRGADVAFTTFCKPEAKTLNAAPIATTTAGLNGSVKPNGPETTYHYEAGDDPNVLGAFTPERIAGSGTDTRQPLTEMASNLTPGKTYYYRVVATNRLGTSVGDVVAFTTIPNAPAGAPGAPGPAGPAGKAAPLSGNLNLRSGDPRALMTIRTNLVKVGQLGRRRGMVRLPIFCKGSVGRNCAGSVKIRSRGLINPATRGVRKKRRVTFTTYDYQLQRGKTGYALGLLSPEKINLMERVKRIKVTVSITVTDSEGNRQTILRNATMVLRRTV
jgi:hypothetical protein